MDVMQLTAAWFDKTARQTKQLMNVRFYLLRESPMTPNDGRWILEVSGVPADNSGKSMRSKLKGMGLWFERQRGNWILDSGSPSEWDLEGNGKWSKHRKNQDKAFPLVKQMAADYNGKVAKPHNDALKKLAPGAATHPRDILKQVDARRRREAWLESAGIDYGSIFPTGRYEFFEAYVFFSGNTYHIKDTLKSFGFKWNSTRKSWQMPYVEWTILESKFFAAAGKKIQSMVRQPKKPTQGTFDAMSKQELGTFILRFFKQTRYNPFEEWFMPYDEADEWPSKLEQVRQVSDYLKEQDYVTQAKMHATMAAGDGDALDRLMNSSNRRAANLIMAWYAEPAPTAAVKNAFSPPSDMADAVSNYFRKTRMNAKDMIRNFPKSPESVIKMLELALKQTGWAKMWWPKKPQDWLAFLKQVA